MDVIRFHTENRRPRYEVSDPAYTALGVWLVMDVGHSATMCLDALAIVDDTLHQREAEEWEGEGFIVDVSLDGVSLRNMYNPDQRGEYPLDFVRQTLERYWAFIIALPGDPQVTRLYRPDLPEWQADLLEWEAAWKRPHPYRGRLGIPVSGPA